MAIRRVVCCKDDGARTGADAKAFFVKFWKCGDTVLRSKIEAIKSKQIQMQAPNKGS